MCSSCVFISPESMSDYRSILKEKQPYILQNINLMSILPYLNAHSLLTDAENEEMLLKTTPEQDRIMALLKALQKKGEEGFHRFLAALEEASDHLTHRSIAERLKQSLSSCKSLHGNYSRMYIRSILFGISNHRASA